MNKKENAKIAFKELAQMVGINGKDEPSTSDTKDSTTPKTAPVANTVEQISKIASTATVIENLPTTVIAGGTEIIGNIRTKGNIEVMGYVQGDIESLGNLTISGKVLGNLNGKMIALSAAQVQGNITTSGNLSINDTSIVVGDIVAKNIELDGKLKGMLDIEQVANINANAVLQGNVSAEKIGMAQGALVTGAINIRNSVNKDLDAVFSQMSFGSDEKNS